MTVGAANGHLERRNQDVDRVRISEIDQFDYPSPMIFVEVSDKEFCLCIDYWHLNAKAISEFIIFPSIEEVAMIISTIPITSVPDDKVLPETTHKRIAEVCNLSKTLLQIIPKNITFGLFNDPFYFCKLIFQILRGLNFFYYII